MGNDYVDAESEDGAALRRSEWRGLAERGLLGTMRPEELFRACIALDTTTDQRLLGELMAALAERAARFLRRRVSISHPNGGADVIHATIGKIQDAILQPGHPDAEGYSISFFAKLDLRLMDQLRKSQKRSGRERPVESDEDGQEIEFPDIAAATPEQAIAIDELLRDIDPRKRQALALTAAGYPAFTDKPGGESVASMLGVSRKTAETWVREAKQFVIERIKG